MPRERIDLPETLPFRHSLIIRVTDINHGGHMGNERVLMYCQEARAAWLASLGLGEGDVGGVGLVVADAAIRFRAEGFAGDCLDIDIGAAAFHRRGCDFFYRLTRRGDCREIARARTGVICFDYRRRRPASAPPTFREQLSE